MAIGRRIPGARDLPDADPPIAVGARWPSGGAPLRRAGAAAGTCPRVLLVAPLPHPPFKGGVEKGVDLLLRTGLARRSSMRLFNTYHRHDPGRPGFQKLKFQAGMVRSFWAELGRFVPDLVHVKTSSGINFYQNSLYCFEARLRSLPVLLQIHSGRFEAFYRSSVLPLQIWIRHTLQTVDRVVVLSEFWRERIGHIAPEARIQVVPNGLGEVEVEALRRAPGSRATQVVFLGTGDRELNRDKGLDDLLSVLPGLARRHPAARWVIAGLDDPEECHRRLRSECLQAGSRPDSVSCLGAVGAGQRTALLRESTILAFPSRFENMPNLLLEGMAAGMGVVATRVGAIPEMLDGGRGGIVINPGDTAALARALDCLLGDPRLVRRQGRHNEARVATRYTMAVVEGLFEELYREAAPARRAIPRPVQVPPDSEAALEALVPIHAPLAADAVGEVGRAGSSALFRSAVSIFAREALRMSADLLRPSRMMAVDPLRARADLRLESDVFLPDSWSFQAPPGPAPDSRLLPPGSARPPAGGKRSPGSLREDCPARRKRLD